MTIHKSVLLKEAVDALNLKNGSVVVDATLGGGGHSQEILKRILPDGKLIAIDRDKKAVENFLLKIKNGEQSNDIEEERNLFLKNDNFSEIKSILKSVGINKVDAILADFGLSSDQLDDRDRGFSFLSDAGLDMRMDRNQKITAKDIVNEYSEKELIHIFRDFGEEKYAQRIAKKIIEERTREEIKSTKKLVEIISVVVPEKDKHKRIHFATKVFQAIRMEVNQELESIERFIVDAVDCLKENGRLAVISFHSGEDRIVKKIFKNLEKGCVCPPEFPVCRCDKRAVIRIITKKPIIANDEEVKANPRARSARMRIIEKIKNKK